MKKIQIFELIESFIILLGFIAIIAASALMIVECIMYRDVLSIECKVWSIIISILLLVFVFVIINGIIRKRRNSQKKQTLE